MGKTIERISVVVLAAAVIVAAVILMFGKPQTVQGSVAFANEYTATTTSPSFSTRSEILLKTGTGSLGSLVQTAAGTAGCHIDLYNATTSRLNQRASDKATSSILVASLPFNAAANTYVYDAQFYDGLLMTFSCAATSRATTTITYR